MTLSLALLLLPLGAMGGFLAGLLGIGGGMFLVPALTWVFALLGMSGGDLVKVAIASSLATIMLTSLSSIRAHHSRGAIEWSIVRSVAPGLVAGALIGAQFARFIPGQWMAWFFAVFVGYSGFQMLLDKKPSPGRMLPGKAGQAGVGVGIGVLSALVGAGGGFLSVPFMVWCNVAIHRAVATSAALGFPIAVAGTVGYVVSGWGRVESLPNTVGYLHWPTILVISVCSVLFAPLGAHAAHRMNVKQLKRAFGVLLLGLAAYMALR
ncbi:MAG: sulfite exporter TauE/SafE family protein [Pigmentiphaga sp.]